MASEQTFTYPLTTDQMHAAMARGRALRSVAFWSWLSSARECERGDDPHPTAPGGVATSAG
jgi:hypothetical protein